MEQHEIISSCKKTLPNEILFGPCTKGTSSKLQMRSLAAIFIKKGKHFIHREENPYM